MVGGAGRARTMPAAARLPRTPSVVDACFASLEARRAASTGIVSRAEADIFTDSVEEGGFTMPIAVYELVERERRGTEMKDKEDKHDLGYRNWTVDLQRIFSQMNRPELMQVHIDWDYTQKVDARAAVQGALRELLLAIDSVYQYLNGGRKRYTSIYVKKVHGKKDYGQPPPATRDAMGRPVSAFELQQQAAMQLFTDAMVKVMEFNPVTGDVRFYQSGSLDGMITKIIENVYEKVHLQKQNGNTDVAKQDALEYLQSDPLRIYISKGDDAPGLFEHYDGKNAAKTFEGRLAELIRNMERRTRPLSPPTPVRGMQPDVVMEGAAFDALSLSEAETGVCRFGIGAECALQRKRKAAMTRLTQLLNMFYAVTKDPKSQGANENKTAEQLWNELGNHYKTNEEIVKPNFPNQTKAAWLKTATFGEASRMAETAQDMQTFQNNVLSGQMGFKRSKDSFAPPAKPDKFNLRKG